MKSKIILLLAIAFTYGCLEESKSESKSTPQEAGCPNAATTPVSDKGIGALYCGGQTYKIVRIGSQIWMAQNLNYAVEGSVCYGESGPLWCYSENGIPQQAEIKANCAKYGRLYDWNAAMKACPKGWHLPTSAEWDKLLRLADGDKGTKSPHKSKIAGKFLKAKFGWKNNSDKPGNGTDIFGFAALPGGFYSEGNDGLSCYNVGRYGKWWSASESNEFAHGTQMNGIEGHATPVTHCDEGCMYVCENDTACEACCSLGAPKNNMLSVRCVRDLL